MATPIVMPRLGDFMTEGTVVRLARSQGDEVGRGEVIAEIETEKLNYDLEAVAGGIFHPVVVEGATVAVDGLIAYVLEAGEKAPEAGDATSAVCADQRSSGPGAPSRRRERRGVAHSARLRALAGSLPVSDVDLSQVTPTGPGGRIVEADVRTFSEQQSAAPAVVPSTPGSAPTRVQPRRRSLADHAHRTQRSDRRGRRSSIRRPAKAGNAAGSARAIAQRTPARDASQHRAAHGR